MVARERARMLSLMITTMRMLGTAFFILALSPVLPHWAPWVSIALGGAAIPNVLVFVGFNLLGAFRDQPAMVTDTGTRSHILRADKRLYAPPERELVTWRHLHGAFVISGGDSTVCPVCATGYEPDDVNYAPGWPRLRLLYHECRDSRESMQGVKLYGSVLQAITLRPGEPLPACRACGSSQWEEESPGRS